MVNVSARQLLDSGGYAELKKIPLKGGPVSMKKPAQR